MEKIKVLIVDDNVTFLRAAMLSLSTLPQLQVVGTARSGPIALAVAQLKQPDLILMDVNMPGMDGLRTAARMRSDGIGAKIVLVSLDETAQARAHDFGVVLDGFIAKADFAECITPVVERLFPTRMPSACGGQR